MSDVDASSPEGREIMAAAQHGTLVGGSDWTIASGDGWTLRDDPNEAAPVLTLRGVEIPVTAKQATRISALARTVQSESRMGGLSKADEA